MIIPQTETLLPELTQFVRHLAARHQNGTLDNWRAFSQQVREFFTPTMMDKTEQIVPGWGQMAGHAEQQTLIHVISVWTALHVLTEYQQAAPEQKTLMAWIVLFHDVAKIPRPAEHDFVHGFRSAVRAGRGLAGAGFPVTENYPALIDDWSTRTYNAVTFREDLQAIVPDNRQLPGIVSGIDRLYGAHAPAGLIIKGVLLHLSIDNDPDYPTPAPLTDDEIRLYVDAALFPLLKMLLLADTDGWNLFNPEAQQHYRQQTRAAFEKISAWIV